MRTANSTLTRRTSDTDNFGFSAVYVSACYHLEHGSSLEADGHDTIFPPRASTSTREPWPKMHSQSIMCPLRAPQVMSVDWHLPCRGMDSATHIQGKGVTPRRKDRRGDRYRKTHDGQEIEEDGGIQEGSTPLLVGGFHTYFRHRLGLVLAFQIRLGNTKETNALVSFLWHALETESRYYAMLIGFANVTLSDLVFESTFLDLVALNRTPTANEERYAAHTVAVSMEHVPSLLLFLVLMMMLLLPLSSGGLVLMIPFGPSIDMSR